MREVDLELDYCPKCEPEETQDPLFRRPGWA